MSIVALVMRTSFPEIAIEIGLDIRFSNTTFLTVASSIAFALLLHPALPTVNKKVWKRLEVKMDEDMEAVMCFLYIFRILLKRHRQKSIICHFPAPNDDKIL
mgnify:CR=1 FL=1